MGEIKSTIDLVMEKTKHLIMTKDEKSLAKSDFAKQKLNGLIQKFKDGLLTRDKFGKSLDLIAGETDVKILPLLLKELLDQITLFEDNSRCIELLQNFCGISVKELKSALNNFQEDYQSALRDRIKTSKEEIFQKHGISGSAVVPNLDQDSQWQKQYQEICLIHQKILATQKAYYFSVWSKD